MASWQDLAKQNRTVANELFSNSRWRSCVSRAYYAVYSEAIRALTRMRVTMPAGRTNPTHARLPNLIGYGLHVLPSRARWELSSRVKKLYDLRVMADYIPAIDIDEPEARIALGLMNRAFESLEKVK